MYWLVLVTHTHFSSFYNTRDRVEGRACVNMKSLWRASFAFIEIKVDDVAHFSSRTVNKPIVPVKRKSS